MTDEAVPAGFEPITSTNAFGGIIGPIYEGRDGQGWVRGLRVDERHTNRGGVAHGGLLMSFADIVAARAAMEVTGKRFVTLRMAADFVAPALLGVWLEGRAKLVAEKGSTLFIDCRLEAGVKLILRASAVFRILQA